MNKVVSIILFLGMFASHKGQEVKSDSLGESECFSHIKNELIFRTFIGIKNLDYYQKSHFLRDNERITDYDAPTTLDFGFGIHTDFFGWHFWFTSGKILDNDPNDQDRKLLDIQANFYNQRLSYDINYQNYQGLYAYNGDDYIMYRPNTRVQHLGGNLLYTLNKDFCLPSSFTQVSRQNISQGTWLLFSGLSHTELFLPQEQELQNRTFSNFSLGGGYSYNLVYKKIFINFLGAIAPAIQRQSLDGAKNYALGFQFNGRFGVGYNGDRCIYGVTFVDDSQSFKYEGMHDRLDKYHFKFFVGYRFTYDWNKHKLTAWLVD